jgi:hypothetical protein
MSEAEQPRRRRNGCKVRLCRAWHKFRSDPIQWFTLVLAGSTLLLWIESCDTRAVLLAGQRAWVAPHDIEPLQADWETKNYVELRLPYVNVGKEPALHFKAEVRSGTMATEDFWKQGKVRATIDDVLKLSCASVAPNEGDTVAYPGLTDVQLLPFDKDKIEKTKTKRYFPLVVGCFAYKISDNTVHHTEFCAILEPIPDAPFWRSTSCITGNKAN